MPLVRLEGKKGRRTFGVSLAEEFAAALGAEAKRLEMTPTTLAARLLERALQDRTQIAPPERPAEGPGHAEILAALHALQGEIVALREADAEPSARRRESAHDDPGRSPDPDPEILALLQGLARDLAGLKRAHHNAAVKLLQAATGMSKKELEDWARLHLKG